MKAIKQILIAIITCVGLQSFAQQMPAPAQSAAITITGATAHIGNGSVIENSIIVFENGVITAVGNSGTPTKGRIIDASGKHVYPGFIAPAKSLGLVEVNAVRASNDQDEIGDFIPNIRSLIAYNAESKVVESMRPNGILVGQVTPQGGRISGTSSIVQFDAWNWEDAAVKVDDGIHMNWPNSFSRGRWWLGEPRGWKPNKDYSKRLDEIKNYMANSRAYGMSEDQPMNEGFAAMQGLYDGSKKLYIYVQGEKEIIDAVTLCKDSGIKDPVIVGGNEAHKIIPFLKQHNIPVLVRQTHSRPSRDDDDYDLPYRLPKLLVDGGLLVGLQNANMSNFQTRNLPFYAGQLVGQGMDKETALQLITGNTAKILGIDGTHGTLETGKSATLFISEGDALDMRTNLLTNAFIDGREISLETHQTELWKRYMEKYSRE
ncbi:MAG: amidohydrolase family protein [Bacteroidia bacterium]|nr:amidohydrolase family protein [Bacteroidia bacterium]NNF30153.1 amidohydrolase family protein [Flavobacteriaceae bacterium]MBT8275031.1 amidohydrolase family protein [Bacteroidia bacterium]NNJ81073.1 amidohydrolase family protein [Flavobacteriaceae bacterium]NNK55483.1 amidohydrolase family protein [Flavobacteriaceae bacterium]